MICIHKSCFNVRKTVLTSLLGGSKADELLMQHSCHSAVQPRRCSTSEVSNITWQESGVHRSLIFVFCFTYHRHSVLHKIAHVTLDISDATNSRYIVVLYLEVASSLSTSSTSAEQGVRSALVSLSLPQKTSRLVLKSWLLRFLRMHHQSCVCRSFYHCGSG